MLAYQKDKETKKISKIENKIIEKIFELIINQGWKFYFFMIYTLQEKIFLIIIIIIKY